MVIYVKIILKRDLSSDDARFEIFDELGALYLRAAGRRTPSGETIRLLRDGETVAKIRGLDLSLLNTCIITTPTENVRLVITAAHGEMSVRFRGISFHLRGNVLSGSYDILDADNTTVAAVTKRFSQGYTEMTIYNSARELCCIAVLVCIESIAVDPTPALQTV